MTKADDEAAAFFEVEANREPATDAPIGRPAARALSKHVPVRFEASMIESVQRCAEEDGMTVSSWIRRLVGREVEARSSRRTRTFLDVSGATVQIVRFASNVDAEPSETSSSFSSEADVALLVG